MVLATICLAVVAQVVAFTFYDLFFTINEYNSNHDTVRQNDER